MSRKLPIGDRMSSDFRVSGHNGQDTTTRLPRPRGSHSPNPDRRGRTGHSPPRIPDHTLLRRIGQGSYGEVWLARNVMGSWRAVKVVYRDSFDSDRPYEREFTGIQHFEPVSRSHESQVDILHVGRNDCDGCFYYVMELADDAGVQQPPSAPDETTRGAQPGTPLSLSINPATYEPLTLTWLLQQRGRLPVADCLQIAVSLCTALAHLHQHGLVHRDVKPSNIIFVDGVAKLADIGLVADAHATCSFVGTEGYLPPEGPGTPKADLYSLGKVLYEISIGADRRDFPKLPQSWDHLQANNEFLELNAIILKTCKRDPHERYPSAQHLLHDLLLLQAGKSVRRTHQLERRLAAASRFARIVTVVSIVAIAAYLWATHQNHLVQDHLTQAEAQRNRAELSESALQEELRRALLHEAQALRHSQRPGQRFQALAALKRAASIRPGPDLRDEALASMELVDIRDSGRGKAFPEGSHTRQFDPDYHYYCWSDLDGNTTVRRTTDDSDVAVLPGPGHRSWVYRFSPNRQFLAAKYHPPFGERNNQTFVWDLSQERVLVDVPAGIQHTSIAFTPDNQRFVAASMNGFLLFYDLASGQPTQRLPLPFEPDSLQFNPAGNLLAISTVQGDVHLLDLQSFSIVRSLPHPQRSRQLAWHPDGTALAVPCEDWRVYVWDIEHDRLSSVLSGHHAQVIGAAYSEDGRLLATTAWDRTLRLWDASRSSPLLTIPHFASASYFHFHDSLIGPFIDGERLGLWELAAPEPVYESTGITLDTFNQAALSHHQPILACLQRNGVSLWNFNSASQLAFLPLEGARALTFSPAGPLLIDGAKGVLTWPADTQGTLDSPADSGLDNVAISPDGRWIVSFGSLDDAVRVSDAQTGEPIRTLPIPAAERALFSPNGAWLAIDSAQGFFLVDGQTWQVRHRMDGGNRSDSWPDRMCFSRNGDLLAIATSRQTIQLIHTASLELLLRLKSLVQLPIGFSHDDRFLLVHGQQGGIYRWNLDQIHRQLDDIGLGWPILNVHGRDRDPASRDAIPAAIIPPGSAPAPTELARASPVPRSPSLPPLSRAARSTGAQPSPLRNP